MKDVTRKLERTLGPETGDLCMRFGLHSGPVTAGVLQGDRSRFQLFGDTVNTAARMESNGKRNCIQVSETTASLLTDAGKGHWVTPREDAVSVKGKGEMRTFWIDTNEAIIRRRPTRGDSMKSTFTSDNMSVVTASTDERDDIEIDNQLPDGSAPPRGMLKAQQNMIWANSEVLDEMPPPLRRSSSDSTSRLIDWNVDILLRLLRQVAAKRLSQSRSELSPEMDFRSETTGAPLEEVAEIIALPSFDPISAKDRIDPESIELDEDAVFQLREYVTTIASL